MEKRKNKKKLFAIIAGSALAFVLTIALSVSITLAYFGETASNNQTITMGGAVYIGTSAATDGEGITMSAPVEDALPGQAVSVTATIALTTSDGETQTAFIAVRPTFTSDAAVTGLETLKTALSLETAEASTTSLGTWVVVNGWYFLTSSGTGDAAVLKPVTLNGTTPTNVVAKASGIVPIGLRNDVATQAISANFEVVAVQGTAFDNLGAKIDNASIAQAIAMFTQINAECTLTA